MRISAQIDMSRAIEKLRTLPQKVQDRAIKDTINKVADRTNTAMKREITGEYTMKSGRVGEQLKVIKASNKGAVIQAILKATGSGKGRNIGSFKFSVVKGSGPYKYVRAKMKDGSWKMLKVRAGAGVKYQIKKNGAVHFLPGAWLATNGVAVLFRDQRQDYKVRGFTTIDVPEMFNAKRINQRVIEFAKQQLIIETERSLKRFKG